MLAFRNEGFLCDSILITGESGFLAHSVILAAASPVLKAALTEGPTDTGLYHIDLHEYDFFTVEAAVHFMYTGYLLLPTEYKKDLQLGPRAKENRLLLLVNNLEKMGIRKERINKCEVKFKRLINFIVFFLVSISLSHRNIL